MKHQRSMVVRSIAIAISTALVVSTSGCVMGYRGFPSPGAADPSRIAGTLHYRVRGGTVFSGEGALRETMVRASPFARTIRVQSEMRSETHFVDVQVETVRPSTPALAFGYLSFSFLFLLPFWSTQDGYDVLFEVYQEGELSDAYEYQVRRTTVGWLAVLPFAWISLALPDESDAFEGITRQFYADAGTTLAGSSGD